MSHLIKTFVSTLTLNVRNYFLIEMKIFLLLTAFTDTITVLCLFLTNPIQA